MRTVHWQKSYGLKLDKAGLCLLHQRLRRPPGGRADEHTPHADSPRGKARLKIETALSACDCPMREAVGIYGRRSQFERLIGGRLPRRRR